MATTKTLANWAVELKYEGIPRQVVEDAKKTFYNWLGCAIGGSSHEAVSIAIEALDELSGPRKASLYGRTEKFDVSHAALINGISSHVFDFDDTHLKTIIHPAGPVASALLALAESEGLTGKQFLTALVAGIEAECRIGNAVYPDHYDNGWHITGTAGVFGAAIAVGKALGLDELRMTYALGLAGSQPVGLRDQFGTMTKSFHPGRAAQNGHLAARLASKGYTTTLGIFENKRGWTNAISTKRDLTEITEGLGTRWEISLNSFKPFACGIVLHPIIDGCIRLRNEHGLNSDLTKIERIDVVVNPLVLELTGKTRPKDGLEGKFSYTHVCSAALIAGKCGEREFADSLVNGPETVALRQKVFATVDDKMPTDCALVTIVTSNQGTLTKEIIHAVGSADTPLTKQQLEDKFEDQVEPILGLERAKQITGVCDELEQVENLSDLIKITVR
jgi:2-methylcitrate dehydratase PrpD